MNQAPAVRAWRRLVEVAALAGGVAGVMLALEAAKQWLHPEITVWESHVITVALSTAAGAIAGYAVLRRGDRLRDRLVATAEQRQHAAENASRANALLAATLESNRDGVLVAGFDGTILTSNRQFLVIWRMEESMAQGPPGS